MTRPAIRIMDNEACNLNGNTIQRAVIQILFVIGMYILECFGLLLISMVWQIIWYGQIN